MYSIIAIILSISFVTPYIIVSYIHVLVIQYVIVKAQLPGIYGSKPPEDEVGLCCHKSLATGL